MAAAMRAASASASSVVGMSPSARVALRRSVTPRPPSMVRQHCGVSRARAWTMVPSSVSGSGPSGGTGTLVFGGVLRMVLAPDGERPGGHSLRGRPGWMRSGGAGHRHHPARRRRPPWRRDDGGEGERLGHGIHTRPVLAVVPTEPARPVDLGDLGGCRAAVPVVPDVGVGGASSVSLRGAGVMRSPLGDRPARVEQCGRRPRGRSG